MRVFASDMIKKMMGRFGIPEDEPIQNRLVTKSIESAQEKIEGFHFDSRKHLLEYDDVMATQRETIYKRRYAVLFADSNRLDVLLEDVIEKAEISEPHQSSALLKKQEMGDEAFYETLRRLMLQVNDMLWVEHLETMDYMRSSVKLRAYGQRDPLVEYKREGLTLFRNLEIAVAAEILNLLPRIQTGIKKEEPKEVKEVHESARLIGSESKEAETRDMPIVARPRDKDGHKLGRNEQCYCGSGQKFKRCHGQ